MENKNSAVEKTRMRTACFTGHRDIPDALVDEITERTRRAVERLIQQGYRYFGAGGARGYDAMASETVLELRRQYPVIHLILVLPFPEQYKHETGWTQRDIKQYHFLQERASKVRFVADRYSKGIYFQRNRILVDWSSACVAYMTREKSGTGYTVSYAKSKGLYVTNTAK